MGGTTDPAANCPSNLLLLCGSATTAYGPCLLLDDGSVEPIGRAAA